MGRVRRLELMLVGKRTKEGLDILEDVLGKEAAEMESLCLSFASDVDTQPGGLLKVPLTLMPGHVLFNGQAPRLKTLKFINCDLVSTLNSELNCVFQNLVTLELDHCLMDFLELDDAFKWWDLCRSGGMPRLENLSLRFLTRSVDPKPLPPSPGGRTPSRRGTSPSSLKFLCLEGLVEPCIALLGLMEVPTSCTVHLYVEAANPNRPEEALVSRTVTPQSEPTALVSALSRMWRDNTTPCAELSVTLKQNETLRLLHRSPAREIMVLIEPSYEGEYPDPDGTWDVLDFYRPFFNHIARPEHLPDLSEDNGASLTLDIAHKEKPILDSAFAQFLMQFRKVARLRLMGWVPYVLTANGETRDLFRITPADIACGSASSISVRSDLFSSTLLLPSIRQMTVPDHWLLHDTFRSRLKRFIDERGSPAGFTVIGTKSDYS
ncbi:hypothetical protein H1R20_g1891, partial [Candolleomyces eurysporus]